MGFRLQHLCIALFSGALLTACSGVVVVSSQYIDQSYNSIQPGFATRNGEQIPVIIQGNPFNTDRTTLDNAVISAMQGKNFGPVVEFAIDPPRPATQNSRVVMAFNPKTPFDANRLCRTRPEIMATPGATLHIAAAYCEGSYTLTSANVRANDVEGPQSEKFREMAVRMTQTLFPPFNPNASKGGDSCIVC